MVWPANDPVKEISSAQREAWRQQFGASDAMLGFEIGPDFEPFHQIDDMFTRAFWDEDVKSADADAFFASYRMDAVARRGKGFSQKDFALRNAAWAISDIISNRAGDRGIREGFQAPIENDTPVAPIQFAIEDVSAQSAEIKSLAKLFGADLIGITAIDERWHYASRVDTRDFSPLPNDLPEGVTHVIVLGHAMDHDLVATYPAALAGASTGLEYSHESAIVIQLASYIRNLGYEAVASMNDTALVIPYAIKAGLGEYGRNQMVITPEFGPRVRFSKIFTSLPVIADEPKALGIRQYCDICSKCAKACPPKALPFGPPESGGPNRSTIKGVKKWSANCEKCFGYWAKLKTDCAICMRVCPFNQPVGSRYGKIFQKLARSRWRRLALWLDQRAGVAKRLDPAQWWLRMQR